MDCHSHWCALFQRKPIFIFYFWFIFCFVSNFENCSCTSVIITMVWLHRDRHRALRSRIHQPLLLDSEECHVPPTRATTQGDKRQWLCQNRHILRVGLPGHAKDRPGEFFPSLSLSDPDKRQQTPGMSGKSMQVTLSPSYSDFDYCDWEETF